MTETEQAAEKIREKIASGKAAETTARNLGHLKRVLPLVPHGKYGLEIGCFVGGATNWLLANGLLRIDVVDTFKGSPEHQDLLDCSGLLAQFKANTMGNIGIINIHEGRSDCVLPELLVRGKVYDFIYVDASHDSRDVILDAELSFKLLKPGGVMVFDDYEWDMYDEPYRNPKPAIDFFLACHADELEIIEKNYQVSLRKL